MRTRGTALITHIHPSASQTLGSGLTAFWMWDCAFCSSQSTKRPAEQGGHGPCWPTASQIW